ncbi:DNA-binding MarR family transcriptional regulator [Actinoplanes octamycinicus]|uniref:DNA-binding MarR family transcriptional regulator n=1 Tax=Actinoplanes octamycinicus TaxID=135948 RepID=A0A7W7H752_9ACTN|nr:MarR family transcriptional regulator [Actinoplanes octamycinicus]MBB4745255.1 DNA-binding MarR family transcriptional regulator [Actinoplanes octamycinicus]GIE62267.1 MarR family transcriptional regulator [Actinoplanes octamycinicus]
MTDPAPGLNAEQLGAYFALIEVSSLLQYAVDEHLRADGDLSFVQFQILARLVDAPDGRLRMTDLADGLVYSRSGLTYQVGLLDKRGLIARSASPDDERSVMVTVTAAGRDLVAHVLPGHVDRVRQLLFEPMTGTDLATLGELLGRVRDHMRATPPRSAKPRARRDRTA